MQKFLMILWLVLTSSIAYGDRSDLILKAREDGGKVIIAPKNSSGAVSATITIDPEAQTVSVANGQLLVNGVQANFAIGSIQQSILTEANFQAQMGSDWVAMKGQDVSGSKLCTDYSICTLPDARNRFLRNSDAADTNIRGLVSDTTAKNGMGITGSVSAANAAHTHGATGLSGSMSAAEFEHSHSDDFSVDSLGTTNVSLASGSASGGTWSISGSTGPESGHFHGQSIFVAATGGSGIGFFADFATGSGQNPQNSNTYTSSGHTHSTLSGSATRTGNSSVSGTTNIAHGHTLSGSVGPDNVSTAQAVSISGTTASDNANHSHGDTFDLSGDSETAPDHIIVNTFVKIN